MCRKQYKMNCIHGMISRQIRPSITLAEKALLEFKQGKTKKMGFDEL
jgi:hypothetical protein